MVVEKGWFLVPYMPEPSPSIWLESQKVSDFGLDTNLLLPAKHGCYHLAMCRRGRLLFLETTLEKGNTKSVQAPACFHCQTSSPEKRRNECRHLLQLHEIAFNNRRQTEWWPKRWLYTSFGNQSMVSKKNVPLLGSLHPWSTCFL